MALKNKEKCMRPQIINSNQRCKAQGEIKLSSMGGPSPEVCEQIFEDLVLVLDCLDDGLHHLRAVAAHIRVRY